MIKKVLCLTHSQDHYVPELVGEHLALLDLQMIRLDTDCFPLQVEISAWQSNCAVSGQITIAGQTHQLADFTAVWFRKNQQSDLRSELQGDVLKQATKEANTAKNAILYALESAFWFDSPFDILRGENKQLQLMLARQSGLTIPNSLLTNSPVEALAFYQQQKKHIISKMLTPLTTFMSKAKSFVYTSKVQEKHIEQLDSLKFCPMQFQQEIDKAYELRVVYVAGEFFTGKIATTAVTDDNKPDWRRARGQDFIWQTYTLPKEVCDKIVRLMNKLSLNFGALDLIKSTDGEYVFLEVNPCGEWGMLQKELDLPIAQHIARAIKNNSIKSDNNEGTQNG